MRYVILLLVLCYGNVNAQVEQKEVTIVLPDTFLITQPEEVLFVTSTDTFETADIDTITDEVFLLETERHWFGSKYVVALKRPGGYNALDPVDGIWSVTDSVSADTMDFDGLGRPELLVRWSVYMGHTGWENSIHERYKGVLLFDIDSLRILFAFQNYYSMQNWWTVCAQDSTGELSYDQPGILDSGGTASCESYDAKFGKRNVIITQTNDCPDHGEMNDYPVTDNKIHRYELTPAGLVRKQ